MKKCMNKYGYNKTEMMVFAIGFISLLVTIVGYLINWATSNDNVSTAADFLVIIGSLAFLITAIISLALACRRYMRNKDAMNNNNSTVNGNTNTITPVVVEHDNDSSSLESHRE